MDTSINTGLSSSSSPLPLLFSQAISQSMEEGTWVGRDVRNIWGHPDYLAWLPDIRESRMLWRLSSWPSSSWEVCPACPSPWRAAATAGVPHRPRPAGDTQHSRPCPAVSPGWGGRGRWGCWWWPSPPAAGRCRGLGLYNINTTNTTNTTITYLITAQIRTGRKKIKKTSGVPSLTLATAVFAPHRRYSWWPGSQERGPTWWTAPCQTPTVNTATQLSRRTDSRPRL